MTTVGTNIDSAYIILWRLGCPKTALTTVILEKLLWKSSVSTHWLIFSSINHTFIQWHYHCSLPILKYHFMYSSYITVHIFHNHFITLILGARFLANAPSHHPSFREWENLEGSLQLLQPSMPPLESVPLQNLSSIFSSTTSQTHHQV